MKPKTWASLAAWVVGLLCLGFIVFAGLHTAGYTAPAKPALTQAQLQARVQAAVPKPKLVAATVKPKSASSPQPTKSSSPAKTSAQKPATTTQPSPAVAAVPVVTPSQTPLPNTGPGSLIWLFIITSLLGMLLYYGHWFARRIFTKPDELS